MPQSATHRILQLLATHPQSSLTSAECAQQLALPKSFNTHSSLLHLCDHKLVEKQDGTKPFAYHITPLGQERAGELATQSPRRKANKPRAARPPRKSGATESTAVRVTTSTAPPTSRSTAAQAFAESLIDNMRRAVMLVRTVIDADLDGLTPALEAALDNADHAATLLATGYRAVA